MNVNSVVLFDACVLYPAPLRDLLFHIAQTNLFRAKVTNDIHDEWIRNVLKNKPNLVKEKLEGTRNLMNLAVRDCLITDYEALIPNLVLPDPNDCHVLAAAIRSGADTILTYNIKDFPNDVLSKFNIEAQHPDDFISTLIEVSGGLICTTIRRLRESLKNPPKTSHEYLEILEKQSLPQTVSLLREYTNII